MTDEDLERRLRDWYRAEIPADLAAPAGLRAELAAIPQASPENVRRFTRRRGLTLLAAAVLLTSAVVGGVLPAGSDDDDAPAVVVSSAVPTKLASELPSAEPSIVPVAGRIVYTRWKTLRDGEEDCTTTNIICHRATVYISNDDGSDERVLVAGPYSYVLAASADGTKVLVRRRDADGDHTYLTDINGSPLRRLETRCEAPCIEDWFGFNFTADGGRLAWVRALRDEVSVIAIMDVSTGAVVQLASTVDIAARPGLSPDGARVAFGNHVVDADGSNLRQIAPADLFTDEQFGVFSAGIATPQWSPDGSLIAFTSFNDTITTDPPDNSQRLMDVYVVRPDGTELHRLTTDTVEPLGTNGPGDFGAGFPTWTRDGRIAFSRFPAQSEDLFFELWVMDADGSNATRVDPSNAAALTALGCVVCPYPGTTPHETGIPSFAYWIPAR